MRVLILGYGVQGKKRYRIAGKDAVGIVDPVMPEANWRDISEVSLDSYDAVLACIPDEPKVKILKYLLGHGKHVLLEKPLYAEDDAEMAEIEALARANKVTYYTAYNHRFEPHFVRMHELIKSGALGKIYRCRMFYGNGTARLVRESTWRDQGSGVLSDLGSHLLDTARFWFGDLGESFRLTSVSRFENRAPDHVVVASETSEPKIELEMTLLSWRNHFTCDILAEKGTAHIESLCKWGPTTFSHRTRILPSGRPPEESITLVQDDPTWALEYHHFKSLVAKGIQSDLANDRWLLRILSRLWTEAASAPSLR